ncbi:MAG: hypothetical protein D4S01_11000 [Dehalococcoidia bacterium]|nr:MAG: hypothetical protein D4S01_11000 [Dehalococcoidia bacterium]
MDPGTYNFTMYQGASFAKQLILKEDSVVRDISGYTGRMQIRDKLTKALIVTMTTENDKIVITGASGRIDLVLVATETELFNFNKALYDLEIINGTTVERVLQGEITLDRNKTV